MTPKRTQTIPWAPFSEKHKRYIAAAIENRICVAEGAIRSGKTIDHCIIAAAYLEKCRDRIHLASGSTIANAKLNIGVCNGFGLENLFRGRCKWGKYKDNEALYVYTQTGEKVVIFAGGGKADSYKRILGNSYGLWIATEINEHYDSDDSRESFVKVAFGRQAAALDPKVLWDLNPCNPHHSIYADYIDKYRDDGLEGYLYEHFTIDDNLAISDERREELKAQYDPLSVWYRRDIKGERCVANGLIYQAFADEPGKYIIADPLKWKAEHNTRFSTVMIGVDFGGNKSATKLQATGITPEGIVVALDELRLDHTREKIDPDKLNRRFREFVLKIQGTYGNSQTRADSEEQILISGLRHTAEKERLKTQVLNCLKLPINDRIRLVNLLIAQGRFFVSEKCPCLIDALSTAVWDPDELDDVRLDDGSTDIDSLDALEYSIEPWAKQLERYGFRR